MSPARNPAVRVLLPVACLAVLTSAALGQPRDERQPAGDEAERAPIALTLQVAPMPAEPETLLRLTVAVENRGDRTVSALRFEVSADGRELPVYRDTIFLAPVPPGGRRILPLPNLWASELGRPPPVSGKLRIRVALVEASWVARDETPEGLRWQALGPVEGLPVQTEATVEVLLDVTP